MKERSKMMKVGQETYGILFAELMQSPATCRELVEITGLHLVTTQSLMRVLRRYKVVHISAWETDTLGRDTTPVFTLGKGNDAPRRRMTQNERTRRHRARKVMQQAMAGLAGDPRRMELV